MALEIPLYGWVIFLVFRLVLEVHIHVSSLSLAHFELFILVPVSQSMIREVNLFLFGWVLNIFALIQLVLPFASLESTLAAWVWSLS